MTTPHTSTPSRPGTPAPPRTSATATARLRAASIAPPPPSIARAHAYAHARSAAGAGPAGGGIGRARAAVSRWFAGLSEAVDAARSPAATRQLHAFADLIGRAHDPRPVEAELVRQAAEISGACLVELVVDRDGGEAPAARRLAVWPESAESMTPEAVEAIGHPLALGLWCGDNYQLALRIYATPGRLKGGRWPARTVRRLSTLCALAAAAERGMNAGQRARAEAPSEPGGVVRDATFLNAVLPYALAQARRHRDPLTVLCAEVDGMAGLAASHGVAATGRVAGRVADAVARALRASDIIVRLDDNRVIIVLPGTGGPASLVVADIVRSAVAGACRGVDGLPPLSASLGVASYPAAARDMQGLLAAADEAMNRARARGPNQFATAPAVASPEVTPAASTRRAAG